MSSSREKLSLFAALAASVLISTSCSSRHEITTPETSAPRDEAAFRDEATPLAGRGSGSFYPLASGNRWSYDRVFRIEVRPEVGDPRRYEFPSTAENEQTCIESMDDKSYLIERVTVTYQGMASSAWIRYRQDRTGLYEADDASRPACEPSATLHREIATAEDEPDSHLRQACAGMPPAQQAAWLAAADRIEERRQVVETALGKARHGRRRRATEPPPGELLRLSYPLRVGAQWTLRAEPIVFTERVEGVEALHTPAGTFVAYRIRIELDLLDPNDRISIWYGRNGYLGLDAHFESVAIDDAGNPYGTVISDQEESLTGLSLVRPPRL